MITGTRTCLFPPSALCRYRSATRPRLRAALLLLSKPTYRRLPDYLGLTLTLNLSQRTCNNAQMCARPRAASAVLNCAVTGQLAAALQLCRAAARRLRLRLVQQVCLRLANLLQRAVDAVHRALQQLVRLLHRARILGLQASGLH